jgi:hypothetical protein
MGKIEEELDKLDELENQRIEMLKLEAKIMSILDEVHTMKMRLMTLGLKEPEMLDKNVALWEEFKRRTF